jgi:hypothetical protein
MRRFASTSKFRGILHGFPCIIRTRQSEGKDPLYYAGLSSFSDGPFPEAWRAERAA